MVPVGIKQKVGLFVSQTTTGSTELHHLSQMLTDPHTELFKGLLGNFYIHIVLHMTSK